MVNPKADRFGNILKADDKVLYPVSRVATDDHALKLSAYTVDSIDEKGVIYLADERGVVIGAKAKHVEKVSTKRPQTYSCPECGGSGVITHTVPVFDGTLIKRINATYACNTCHRWGDLPIQEEN